MATLSEMVFDYHKKNHIEYQSGTYSHTYSDGSTELFSIESADKEKALFDHDEKEWYEACVMTRQFSVFVHTDKMPHMNWFDERKFNSIKSAINAIKKDVKE